MTVRAATLARHEVGGAQLGDVRRTARLERIAGQVAAAPRKSLPKQAGSVAALEATYRFLSNKAVSAEAILAPHHTATRERALEQSGAPVLVVHDTTEFDFGKREQLGELNGFRKGFFAHVALVVTADANHRPLGVAATEVLFREALRKRAPAGKAPNEGARWARVVDGASAQLADVRRIHVMDREADAYELMSHIVASGDDFVIRAQTDRILDQRTKTRLSDVLAESAPIIGRSFPVGKRPINPSPRHRARHPERNEHVAHAEISAATVELERTPRREGPPRLSLNIVRVRELVDSKPSGVEWLLWTTLPVGTAEEVLAVVDAYRGRWRIEELFKSLKTGCQFEQLQLESRHALVNALAVYLPVAWLQLHLRALSRIEGVSAALALSPRQLVCLRAAYEAQEGKSLPPVLSAREALFAVARLGGHLKNNGDPGWLTIGRGMHDVLMVEVGMLAAGRAATASGDAINP